MVNLSSAILLTLKYPMILLVFLGDETFLFGQFAQFLFSQDEFFNFLCAINCLYAILDSNK